jgi:hypothetical protein
MSSKYTYGINSCFDSQNKLWINPRPRLLLFYILLFIFLQEDLRFSS